MFQVFCQSFFNDRTYQLDWHTNLIMSFNFRKRCLVSCISTLCRSYTNNLHKWWIHVYHYWTTVGTIAFTRARVRDFFSIFGSERGYTCKNSWTKIFLPSDWLFARAHACVTSFQNLVMEVTIGKRVQILGSQVNSDVLHACTMASRKEFQTSLLLLLVLDGMIPVILEGKIF